MIVRALNRDNYEKIIVPNLDVDVERYSHSVMGGPTEAIIKFTGDDIDLWTLFEYSRCPITIYSDLGDELWWGYVANIEATVRNPLRPNLPRVNVGVSVDTMYNRIAVAYSKVDIDTGTEQRDTTAWAEDTESLDEYGIRELLWSSSSATEEHAEAARDAKLAQRKLPTPIITPTYYDEEPQARLTCRGWWDTLGWRYYANVGTDAVDTAEQVYNILVAKGQFFTNTYQDVESGISIRETRDGDATALYEVNQLLEMGTTNSRRMLATVAPDRSVRIYEEPAIAQTITYQLYSDGSLRDPFGSPLRNELCQVGVWAKWTDVIPPSINTTFLTEPSIQFIDEMEYVVEKNKLYPTARGEIDPWQFPKVRDG